MTSQTQYSDATLASMQRMFGRGFLSPGGAAEVPLIVAGLALAGRRVLDWGCGLGGPTIVLARDCGADKVLGIDIEAGNLAAARANAGAAGLGERVAFQLVEPGPCPSRRAPSTWSSPRRPSATFRYRTSRRSRPTSSACWRPAAISSAATG